MNTRVSQKFCNIYVTSFAFADVVNLTTMDCEMPSIFTSNCYHCIFFYGLEHDIRIQSFRMTIKILANLNAISFLTIRLLYDD